VPFDSELPLSLTTILVVDDSRMARRIASRILSEEGYRVLEADGTEEAMEVLAQARGRVDLLLLDIVLHHGDGVALGRQVHAEWPDQALLYMSAFPAEVMAQYGLETLDVPFLAKPFTRAELLVKVTEALKPGKPGSVARRNITES
jgi:DNA-binding response OmpR family regulator